MSKLTKAGQAGSVSLAIITDADLPDSYAKACNMVDELLVAGQKMALLNAWNIGFIIATIQEDEGHYGSKAVDRMAKQLSRHPRILSEYLRFYKAHRDSNLVSELKLEWSAARELLRITDDKKRSVMEGQVGKQKMPVREVKKWVDEVKAKIVPKDKPVPKKARKPSAINYYKKLVSTLEKDLEALKEMVAKSPEMVLITADETSTNDEDYATIVEGTSKEDALIDQVGELATRLAAYVTTSVVPLKDSFADAEDS